MLWFSSLLKAAQIKRTFAGDERVGAINVADGQRERRGGNDAIGFFKGSQARLGSVTTTWEIYDQVARKHAAKRGYFMQTRYCRAANSLQKESKKFHKSVRLSLITALQCCYSSPLKWK